MSPNKENVSASTCEPVPYTIRLARRLNQHDERRYPNNPCPSCNGSGMLWEYAFEDPAGIKPGNQGNWVPCPVCYDRIHAAKNRLASGLPEELKDKTLTNFDYSESWQRQALEAAVSFAKNPEGLLFLGGQSGCGKSHLAAGIIYYVSKSGSQPPLYYSWPELLAAVRRISRDWKSTDIRETLKDCRTVVVLDDFLAAPNSRPSTAALETAFEIVSARTANKLPTVLASPYTAEKINALYSVLFKKIVRAAGDLLISIDPDERPGRKQRLYQDVNNHAPPNRQRKSRSECYQHPERQAINMPSLSPPSYQKTEGFTMRMAQKISRIEYIFGSVIIQEPNPWATRKDTTCPNKGRSTALWHPGQAVSGCLRKIHTAAKALRSVNNDGPQREEN